MRPSPTAGTLGGVARATRESLVVMAAAGYDILLVETVGVGQSETLVAEMTDTFLLLALARTGDQLQGIKKGVLELADIVAVNKADGPHAAEARRAARELAGALRLLGQPEDGWATPVVTCSAITGDGPGRGVGPGRANTSGCSATAVSWTAGAATSGSAGCGRWCGTSSWIGCGTAASCAR